MNQFMSRATVDVLWTHDVHLKKRRACWRLFLRLLCWLGADVRLRTSRRCSTHGKAPIWTTLLLIWQFAASRTYMDGAHLAGKSSACIIMIRSTVAQANWTDLLLRRRPEVCLSVFCTSVSKKQRYVITLAVHEQIGSSSMLAPCLGKQFFGTACANLALSLQSIMQLSFLIALIHYCLLLMTGWYSFPRP